MASRSMPLSSWLHYIILCYVHIYVYSNLKLLDLNFDSHRSVFTGNSSWLKILVKVFPCKEHHLFKLRAPISTISISSRQRFLLLILQRRKEVTDSTHLNIRRCNSGTGGCEDLWLRNKRIVHPASPLRPPAEYYRYLFIFQEQRSCLLMLLM